MKSKIEPDLEKVYTKYLVDTSVTEWLRDSMELIFNITQKAVQDNRFEIVDSGLKNITEIAREYVSARLNYSSEQDSVISYFDERLIDIKNLVQKDTHPKIMLSIARTAKDIAVSTLQIKPIRSFAGENFIPLGFINLLSGICLSPEILKETSYAPMSTVDYLVEIANSAIDKDFPRTANLVSDKLGQIANVTTILHLPYGDSIAAKANWGLASVLDHMLTNEEKLTLYVEHEIKSILEQIDKSINTYLEDDIKFHYVSRSNIKTFFGPLAEHNLTSVFIKALQKKTTDKRHLNLTLNVLKEYLSNLNQSVMKGMDNSKYLDIKDIIENIYMLGIILVGTIKEQKEPRNQSESLSLLEDHFCFPFINSISMSFTVNPTNRYTIFDDDYMQAFFSLLGILFYENDNQLFDQTLEKWSEKVIEIIQRFKNQITEEHEGHIFEKHEISDPLGNLYRYLRLLGVWVNNFLPKSKLLENIIAEVKNQPTLTISKNAYGEVSMYPSDMMIQRWIVLRPFLPYNTKYFSDIDAKLFNSEIVNKFEKKLKKP